MFQKSTKPPSFIMRINFICSASHTASRSQYSGFQDGWTGFPSVSDTRSSLSPRLQTAPPYSRLHLTPHRLYRSKAYSHLTRSSGWASSHGRPPWSSAYIRGYLIPPPQNKRNSYCPAQMTGTDTVINPRRKSTPSPKVDVHLRDTHNQTSQTTV